MSLVKLAGVGLKPKDLAALVYHSKNENSINKITNSLRKRAIRITRKEGIKGTIQEANNWGSNKDTIEAQKGWIDRLNYGLNRNDKHIKTDKVKRAIELMERMKK